MKTRQFRKEAQSARKEASSFSFSRSPKVNVEDLLNKYSMYRKDSISSIHSPKKNVSSVNTSPIKHPNWSQLQKPVPKLQLHTTGKNEVNNAYKSPKSYSKNYSDSSSDFETVTMVSPTPRNDYSTPQDHLTPSQLKLLREITEKSKKKSPPKRSPHDYTNLSQVKTAINHNTPQTNGTPHKAGSSLTVKSISPGNENINFFRSPVKFKSTSPAEENATSTRSNKISQGSKTSSAASTPTSAKLSSSSTPKSPTNKVITSNIIFTSPPSKKKESSSDSIHEDQILVEKEEGELFSESIGSFEEEETPEYFDSPHTPNLIPPQARFSPTAHQPSGSDQEDRKGNSSPEPLKSDSDYEKSENLEEKSLPNADISSHTDDYHLEEELAESSGNEQDEIIQDGEELDIKNYFKKEVEEANSSNELKSEEESYSSYPAEMILLEEVIQKSNSSELKSESDQSTESSEMILIDGKEIQQNSTNLNSNSDANNKSNELKSESDQSTESSEMILINEKEIHQNSTNSNANNKLNESSSSEEMVLIEPENKEDKLIEVKENEEEEDSAPYFGARIPSSSEDSLIKQESSEMDTSELERFMAEKHDSLAYDSEDDVIEDGITFGSLKNETKEETCDMKTDSQNEKEKSHSSDDHQTVQVEDLHLDEEEGNYEEEDSNQDNGSDVASAGSGHEYTEEVMISDSVGSDSEDSIPSPPRSQQILSNREDKVPDFLGSDSDDLEEEDFPDLDLLNIDYDDDEFDPGSPNASAVRDMDDLNRCQRFDFAVGSDYSGEDFSFGDDISVEPASTHAKRYLDQAINSDEPIKVLLNIGSKLTKEQCEKSLM